MSGSEADPSTAEAAELAENVKLFLQEQMAKGKKHPSVVRALAFNSESLRGRLAAHHVRLLARPRRL
jgi:hypothetical protein